MQVIAYRHTAEDGQQFDLVYDTDDVVSFETPFNIIDITEPGDTAHRREIGDDAHLHLHFKMDKRPRWCPAGSAIATSTESAS